MKRLTLPALLFLACHSPEPKPAAPAASETPAATAIPSVVADASAVSERDAGESGGLAAIAGAPLELWHAEGFDIAVSLPIGARTKRPVVVGIHGSKDRHDLTCARWRRAFAGFPFILCPEGVPYRGGLAWGAPSNMIERIDRALALLREHYPAYVADGPVVYAGWSLGATRGPAVVQLRPGLFEPVVLAEVGHTRLDAKASANAFRTARVGHPIVACATNRCAQFVKRLRGATKEPSIDFVDAGIGRGHLFDETMAHGIGVAIAKAVDADARWSGFASALAGPHEDAGATDEPTADDEEP